MVAHTPHRKRAPVGLCRSRDAALRILLPKMLGLLWQIGRSPDASRRVASLELAGRLEICAFRMDSEVIDLTVLDRDSNWGTVFSAHLQDRSNEPRFKYWDRQCSVLRWKRGEWEVLVAAHTASARSLTGVMATGLVPEIT